ncbi:MAG: polyprenyl synthetase family protein [Candidatus Delongbacteria bacterium]|nr:polyprenyl synthetase family protein [Candidatus Delongbacteria bacterium]MBN2836944.1 polyprenyl synthetase family protein [Candidatus Delongbacteria bacterium]
MDIIDKLKKEREKVDLELMELCSELKPSILYDPIRHAVGIGGKRLRPILVRMVGRMINGTCNKNRYSSLAVELFHNFTLVHDDIMDNDDLRRGHETVHAKWDIATGVLAGDGIIGIAYEALLREKCNSPVNLFKIFTRGVIEVCEGQGYDKEFETRSDVTMDEYLLMIYKKTAALIEVSSKIGAVCAGGDENTIELCSEYGKALGMAFQIQDDCLDIMSTEEKIGKNYGSDVSEGKKTYLYIKALEIFNEVDKLRYLNIMENKVSDLKSILEVKELYLRNGVIKEAETEIRNWIDKAYEILDKLSLKYNTDELREFTGYLLNRDY